MNVENIENKRMLLTSTLFVVLFSITFMGGTALPLIKILDKLFPDENEIRANKKCLDKSDDSIGSNMSRRSRKILLSKTREMNLMDQAEYDRESHDTINKNHIKGYYRRNFFTQFNENIIRPLLIRNISKEVCFNGLI
jgi:hypothetical protein